jgi:hypothetical protein
MSFEDFNYSSFNDSVLVRDTEKEAAQAEAF